MQRVVIQSIGGVAPYVGPNEIPGVRFRAVRQALGVRAWGMNVLELDPGCEGYPEHDHVADQQEEVYVVLRGQAVLVLGDETHTVSEGSLVYVPPDVTRKWVTREHGVQLLALGGTPGRAYPAPEGA